MDNIDNFNKYTVVCLAKLYKSFPVPIALPDCTLVNEVIGEENCWEPNHLRAVINLVDEQDEDYPKQRSNKYNEHSTIARATVNWLVQCHYIQILSINDQYPENSTYVLSPKGLEVLSAIPDSIQPGTFGERLIEASNNVAGETAKAIITKTIGEIIGAAFRAGFGAKTASIYGLYDPA